ncbi:MAG TPA: heavy-metal-associated domain-containing protein [Bacilli bacterium]|nr:heavy-metal-associated domain-containing protein [Bacilli bacterium]
MNKTVFQLETVTCPSCIKRIEGTVSKINGVTSAEVKFNASKVEVNYDEAVVNKELIGKTIASLGYKVLSVK